MHVSTQLSPEEQLTKSFRFQNREILDNYVILAVTDIEGIIQHVSTQLCNVFKYTPKDLLGKPYTFLIKQEFITSFENQFKDIKESKTVWHGEIKSSDKNSTLLWTDTIITPLFNDDEEHVGFIFASNNITQEKKLQKVMEDNLIRKKYDKSTLNFMPSLSSAILFKSSNSLHQLLWLVTLTILSVLIWGYFSKIDIIVKTQGKIVTDKNIQTVSTLNPGIVKNIYVKKGDIVNKGDKIITLSVLDALNNYNQNHIKLLSLYASANRLEAEYTNTPMKSNPLVMRENPKLMNHAFDLYYTDLKKNGYAIKILKEQLKQKKSDLISTKKQLQISKKNLKLINDEIAIKQPLVKQRIISQIELFKLKKERNDLNSKIKSSEISIPSLKAAIQEIHKKIDETIEKNRAKIQVDLIKNYNEIQKTKEDLSYYKQKMQNADILAPSKGVINLITVHNRGEAVKAGSTIAEIIPESSSLLAEVKVKPSDVGFLYVGQPVRIKVRAYPFALYGQIDANISYISADTLKDEQDPKKKVYIVNLKSNKTYVGTNKHLVAKPGMTIDADIITGKRNILEYVFKPIIKSIVNKGSQ